jgi:hypothetical protein
MSTAQESHNFFCLRLRLFLCRSLLSKLHQFQSATNASSDYDFEEVLSRHKRQCACLSQYTPGKKLWNFKNSNFEFIWRFYLYNFCLFQSIANVNKRIQQTATICLAGQLKCFFFGKFSRCFWGLIC